MTEVPRRRFLQGGAAVAAGAAVASTVPGSSASAAAPGYDPRQRFLRLVPGGGGIIYAVQADGPLLWYRHRDWLNGGTGWLNGAGRMIDDGGWQVFTNVLGGAGGHLLAVRGDGAVVWYRYLLADGNTGAGSWHPESGSVIATGFHRYPVVFGGWDGVVYGIDADGDLYWHRYLAGDGSGGTGAWANGGEGRKIGFGWKQYARVWADPNGVIFAARIGGPLHWFRYLAGDGSGGAGAWANGGNPIQVGTGWGDFAQREWLSNGSGVIYLVLLDAGATPDRDDALGWFRLTTSETVHRDGVAWANGGIVKTVGRGFTIERSAVLQGYARDLGVRQGGRAELAVSTTLGSYSASLVRLAPAATDPEPMTEPRILPGRLQTLPGNFREEGCGWATQIAHDVPEGWKSGLYAWRLEGPHGLRHHVVFVVRPATPTAPVAFMLPTNTYNAYNYFGGHNQYTSGESGRRRTVTFHRPGISPEVAPTGQISHTLHSDLLLTRWMTAEGIAFDCYHDGLLHADGNWLPHYKALVLGSHPEYWSDVMRQRVVDYLAGGGRVIYTGGNGLYERVRYTSSGNAMVFRTADGRRDLFRNLGKSESQVLGVEWNPAAYFNFAPYRVTAGHPLLEGTGLAVGDTFGERSYNIAASGWEVDILPDGGVPGATGIAKGTNSGGGADLVFVDKGNGGWVFSASSICFNGALPTDPAVSQILRNVFRRALA